MNKEAKKRNELNERLKYEYPNLRVKVLGPITKDGKFREVEITGTYFQTHEEYDQFMKKHEGYDGLRYPKEKLAIAFEHTYSVLNTKSLVLDDFLFSHLEQFKKQDDKGKLWIYNNMVLSRFVYAPGQNKFKLFNTKTGKLSKEFTHIKFGNHVFHENDYTRDCLSPIQMEDGIYIMDAKNIQILPTKFKEVPNGLKYNSTEQERMDLYSKLLKESPELLPRLYNNVRNFNNPNNYIILINAIMDGLIENHLEDEKYCNKIIKMIKQETKDVAKESNNKDINNETEKIIDAYKSK